MIARKTADLALLKEKSDKRKGLRCVKYCYEWVQALIMTVIVIIFVCGYFHATYLVQFRLCSIFDNEVLHTSIETQTWKTAMADVLFIVIRFVFFLLLYLGAKLSSYLIKTGNCLCYLLGGALGCLILYHFVFISIAGYIYCYLSPTPIRAYYDFTYHPLLLAQEILFLSTVIALLTRKFLFPALSTRLPLYF